MEAPPVSYIQGIPPGMAQPQVPGGIAQPQAIPPVVEGPSIRDAPPDGRNSQNITTGASPLRLAPMRPWRQGCLLYNEDSTNAIRYGEQSNVSGAATGPVGALLPAGVAVILRGSPEIWAVAVAGSPRITVVDEWFSAPPQRQPQGL